MIDAQGLRARAKVLYALRAWFHNQGYLEVPTPVRVDSPAMEEHLFPFACDGRFLRTSPEFALKRVVAAGLPRIYEIGPCFRDRESGPWHATEFLMLEWYRVGASLTDLQLEVTKLVGVAAEAIGVSAPPSWAHLTVAERFEAAGHPLDQLQPEQGCWDTAFFRVWIEHVEPALPSACFVSDWPASQAALSEVRDDGARIRAQRFEAYLNGVELANAFLELRDSDVQRARFDDANRHRIENGEQPHPIDPAFVDAVGRLPPVAGIALGIDRLVACLLSAKGIQCVQFS